MSEIDDDTICAIADGIALFQEYAPQSAEDWIAVARRFNADKGDRSESSPLFAALSLAIEELDIILDRSNNVLHNTERTP